MCAKLKAQPLVHISELHRGVNGGLATEMFPVNTPSVDVAIMHQFSLIGFVTFAGSPLCGSHVVDVGEGSSPHEGNHFQRAPVGGHA